MRWSILVLAVACLGVASWLGAHAPIGAAASNSRMTGVASSSGASDIPPGVRFVSVALGGFRGLLADFLWVRAAELQDEGNFFEVAQLSDWITKLEPRYPEVWAYHAWNMAYNITAVVPDPSDRWHWVKNGLHLLRDEGLPANPDSPKLYWELGWMFFDKVGGRWDEATLFYRINWALEMPAVLRNGAMDYAAVKGQSEPVKALATVGLSPEIMKAVDDAYGPLDWRLPESHVIYWGYRGHSCQGPDGRWCDRLVWMGLLQTMKGGMLAFAPDRRIYQQGPRLDIAIKGIRRCGVDRVFDDPLTGLVAANFLRESALYLYAFGRPTEAAAAQTELRHAPDFRGGTLSLDEFIKHEIAAQMGVLDNASRRERVVGFLARGAIWRRLEVPFFADGFERLARLYWDAFVKLEPTAPVWDVLQREAGERALREVPEPARTPQRNP